MGNLVYACNPVPKTKVVLIGCDYQGTRHNLNQCVNDCRRIKELIPEDVDEEDIAELYDDRSGDGYPDYGSVTAWLDDMATRCGPLDTLVIFFSGHASSVFDESEGYDDREEAFCFRGSRIGTDVEMMVESEFCNRITGHLQKKLGQWPKVLVMLDNIHNGPLLDIDRLAAQGLNPFVGLQVVCLNCYKDGQAATEATSGSMFVSHILRASDELKVTVRDGVPTMSEVFERVKKLGAKDSSHTYTMTWSAEADPVDFPWPL
eukprot:Platyproteum_vivax@DN6263_c0_g1_i1.p1